MGKEKWKASWTVAVFEGRKKIKEIPFKTEKDMAYWLYKNESDIINSH